jgi:hypothetical protein
MFFHSRCKIFVACFLLILPVRILAQDNKLWDKPKDTKKRAADKMDRGKKGFKKMKEHAERWGHADTYKHQVALGGKLNSNGWSGCVYYLKKTGDATHNVWSLGFSEIKHEKQIKQQRQPDAFPDLGEATPFVYGKIHNLYTVQLGYSWEILLLPGVVEDNLSVSFRIGGGFSLAMLKPYYMKVIYPRPEVHVEEIRYTDSTEEMFLKKGNILGGSKWSKGLNETQLVPGAFAEAAFVIEPAKSKYLVQTITVGANFAFYSQSLPIMAEVKAFPWQGNVFVGLALGKRWKGR